MVGASHSIPVASASPAPPVPAAAPAPPVVPAPRRPDARRGPVRERTRWWYENALGWPTAPGEPVRLRTGVRFDVLDVPAAAGYATLERLGRAGAFGAAGAPGVPGALGAAGTPGAPGAAGTCSPVPGFPVAVREERMLLLVAAGGAEELPGLLEWLDWGSLALDLTAVGAGGLVVAPLAPASGPNGVAPSGVAPGGDTPDGPAGCGPDGLPPRPPGRDGLRGAAVWLRPPEPGREVEPSLPALSALGRAGAALDLARLVRTLATQCHRVRLTAGAPPRARPVARVG
ncbi:SCO3374 family protein [Streptomyces ardesiacus]|uniref:SCO3374 family protein n=1 Tax=Streptomyces ardesiacus TaxID=285564 RepID=A0ABW8HLN9_9ACTN